MGEKTDKVSIKMPLVYRGLLDKTRKSIEEFKKENDTTKDDFLKEFSYMFWDYSDEADLKDLKPITAFLTSEAYKATTEINLALANLNSNWKELPIERFIADYLNDFLNYSIPRIINLDNWEEIFEKYYKIFEDEYMSEELTVEFFGHLANFSYRYSDTGELNDHAKIVVLDNLTTGTGHLVLCEKRADYFRVKYAINFCFPKIDIELASKYGYYLHYTRRMKKVSASSMFNFYHLMRKFILAIRVLCYQAWEKPYCDFVVAFHQGKLSAMHHGYSAGFPENKIGEGHNFATMDTPQSTWLKRLWTKLEDEDYLGRFIALDHHLDDSLKREDRSARNPYVDDLKISDELDRLSDYFSAFDSIYKVTKGQTGKIIANYTGKLVTYKRHFGDSRDPRTWEDVKNFIELLYNVRNDYEHGRYRDALIKAGKIEEFKQKVFTLGHYLREVAILYIMNSDFELQLARIKKDDFSNLSTIYY